MPQGLKNFLLAIVYVLIALVGIIFALKYTHIIP